jgi:hypothetical protein
MGAGMKSKLTALTLEYTGANCVGFTNCNSQGEAKTSVEGDPSLQAGGDTVTIAVQGGEMFTGVQIDATVELSIVPHPATIITITSDSTGSVLSLIEFHSSCSVPLFHGDEFGSLRLVGFTTDAGITAPDQCSLPPVCETTTQAPTTTAPEFPPCDACAGTAGNSITMLRFEVVADSTTLSNTQGGLASVTGTAMPSTATTDPTDLTGDFHGELGGCAATMLVQNTGTPADPGPDFNDIYKLDATGCAPYIGRITCENDLGAALKVVRNKFADIEDIARVPASAWNLIASGDSTAPFVTNGAFVIVHNDGAPLGDNIQCRLQSPEHYCFGFPYEAANGDGERYLDYTHLREAGAELDIVSGASSIFPGCAGSRTEAEALNAEADAGGCACVPEVQTLSPNDGIFAFLGIPKGTEGNFATINPTGVFDQTITISTACSGTQPLEVDDQFGMFKLVGFADGADRTSIACGACIDDPNSKKVCQGPGFDGSDTQSIVGRTVCDLETELTEDEFICPTAAGQAGQSAPVDCYCGTVSGVGSSPQQYCLFNKGTFRALSGNWQEVTFTGTVESLSPVPDLTDISTDAVADQKPCCEHYWDTCAILQDSGTNLVPRGGEYDWLASTPTDNMVEALRNMGVDTDGGVFRTSDPATDSSVARGEECAASISPTLGLGDVSLVIRDTTDFDLNPADPVNIIPCFFDEVIPLYCDDIDTYVTSTNQKFCCSGVLLDSSTDNLNSAACLALSYHIQNPKTGMAFENFDVSHFSTELIAGNAQPSQTEADKSTLTKYVGAGFGSAAILCLVVVAALVVRSKLSIRRDAEQQPSESGETSSSADNAREWKAGDFASSVCDTDSNSGGPLRITTHTADLFRPVGTDAPVLDWDGTMGLVAAGGNPAMLGRQHSSGESESTTDMTSLAPSRMDDRATSSEGSTVSDV